MLSVDRDSDGKAIFHPTSNSGQDQLRATDAKLVGELDSKYILATNIGESSNNMTKEKLVITTPNADYLPHVNLGTQTITFCEDGRWGAEDWAQWPQWYFQGQEHFAFLLRKPPPAELLHHPLRRLWWDMKEEDFIATGPNVGLLNLSIAQELYDIRTQLMKEVEACSCLDGLAFQKLQTAAQGMRACTSALVFTPQSFFNVKCTAAAAQRYCLTTRALLDKTKKWDCLPFSDDIRPVDPTILGCVTDRVTLVIELYEKGVPVWFVRPVNKLPRDIVIIEQQTLVKPIHTGVMMKRWKGAPIFYSGPLSVQIHTAIEQWKPGSLDVQLDTSPTETGIERADRVGKRAARREHPYSKLHTADEDSPRTEPTVFTLNEALFRDPTSLYCTRPRPAWSRALQNVKRTQDRIIQHPDLLLFRGYPFPPAHILCAENKQAPLAAVLAWLILRPIWMEKLSRSDRTNLPNPQHWRKKLRDIAIELDFIDPNLKVKPESQPSAPPQDSTPSQPSAPATERKSKSRRSNQAREAAKGFFDVMMPSKENLTPIIWFDRVIWSKDKVDFPLRNRKLVAWDSQEHNFRIELATFDRVLLSTVWSNADGAADRNAKLDAIWPNNFLFMHDLPISAAGISAPYWLDRCEFIEAFRNLLLAWPGETPQHLSKLVPHRTNPTTGRKEWNQKILDQIEVEIATYYTQMFFNYFGRAPSVPHTFPSS